MKLPVQACPVPQQQDVATYNRYVKQNGCGVMEGIKCGAEFAGLVVGPCDPLGFPEDLVLCIPAFAAFVGSCEDCIGGAAKTAICGAVSAAEKIGIPIPGALKSLCG
jgi:hypothetical protein